MSRRFSRSENPQILPAPTRAPKNLRPETTTVLTTLCQIDLLDHDEAPPKAAGLGSNSRSLHDWSSALGKRQESWDRVLGYLVAT